MNLSLEVKKFMNNEHTGDYVSVVLPSELPVERAEVREHNRDKSAAHSAKSFAENKARLAAKARDKAANTQKLLTLKEEELQEAKVVLEEIVSQQKAMLPDLDEKREAFDEASADYDEKNNIYTIKKESFEAMEDAYNAAVEAEKAAVLVLNDCRANFTGAESALAAAKEDGARHEGLLSTTRSEVAETRVLSENAKNDAREAARLESEKNERFNELSEKTAQLLAVMKKEARRLSDAQKTLAAAAKEYSKAAADHSSASEALIAAENMVKESPKADKEALKAKASALRAKLAAAATRMDNAEAAKADAEEALFAAQEANGKAEINYNKVSEMTAACKEELDELRAKSADAAAKAAEAQARFSSVSTNFEKSQNDVEFSVRDVRSREAGLVDSRKALLNAETDVTRRHEAVTNAKAEMDSARAVMEDKQAVMKNSEKIYNTKKAAFDTINSSYQMAERDRRTQKNICDRLETELRMLRDQLDEDISLRDTAAEEAASSEAEAERRRLSVRTINARYETAKVHYIQQGKGEDLILIHSVGQSLYTFRELISRLSSKFRVTALDLVGFGYSEKPYYFNYTPDEMAEFIERFMEALDINWAHMFGFSMGAGYVINFAKRFPDKVGRIVLLSPGGITAEMPSSIRSIDNRIFGGIAARMLSYKSVKKMLGECFFDLTNHTDDLVDEYYKPIATPESKRVIRTCVSFYDDEEVIRNLRDINAETLILWGSEDKWHPTDMANLFQAVMPNVKYTLVRNAGHLAHEEKAERIAQLIKMFIPCGYDEDEETTY
ncbi:MAG: alpha/beta fold hydrolase [Clostridia bacterium]|nr:alpha/beta fold hydrolase [Clostridia bacterium]